jgi:hypothetical protein
LLKDISNVGSGGLLGGGPDCSPLGLGIVDCDSCGDGRGISIFLVFEAEKLIVLVLDHVADNETLFEIDPVKLTDSLFDMEALMDDVAVSEAVPVRDAVLDDEASRVLLVVPVNDTGNVSELLGVRDFVEDLLGVRELDEDRDPVCVLVTERVSEFVVEIVPETLGVFDSGESVLLLVFVWVEVLDGEAIFVDVGEFVMDTVFEGESVSGDLLPVLLVVEVFVGV